MTEREDAIKTFLGANGWGEAERAPLTGDASDRQYFRILPRNAPSLVLAVHPGPIAFDTLPFVNVARLLSAMPVPVPRITMSVAPGSIQSAMSLRSPRSSRRAGTCSSGRVPCSWASASWASAARTSSSTGSNASVPPGPRQASTVWV